MVFAIINNGNVINIEEYNSETIAPQNAIDIHDKPVLIGDTYSDGRFYRNGEEVVSDAEMLGNVNHILSILYEGENEGVDA